MTEKQQLEAVEPLLEQIAPQAAKTPMAAQERPKTALGEAGDWIASQAEQLKEQYPRKFEGSVCEVKYFQLLRYAKACREADEQ